MTLPLTTVSAAQAGEVSNRQHSQAAGSFMGGPGKKDRLL
jgi:hypothetical protein